MIGAYRIVGIMIGAYRIYGRCLSYQTGSCRPRSRFSIEALRCPRFFTSARRTLELSAELNGPSLPFAQQKSHSVR